MHSVLDKYDVDLFNYLYFINDNSTVIKNTINNPRMQQIKKKIVEKMKLENIRLYDNKRKQMDIAESKQLKESSGLYILQTIYVMEILI